MNFYEVVKITESSCKVCFSLVYILPCKVDRNIVNFLKSFGESKYPLDSIKLLRIDADNGYKIESKLDKNVIKFIMPKKLENTNLDETSRKLEFEKCLCNWLTNKLGIEII